MIEDRHKEFAKALVALAREHRMDRLQVQFQDSTTPVDRAWPPVRVSAEWQEGRHGSSANIHLSATTSVHERETVSL